MSEEQTSSCRGRKTPLYSDPGNRVPLNLFRNREKIIFIDCNGEEYELNLVVGKFKVVGWFWEKELPRAYIGTFRFRENDHDLDSFKKEESVDIKSVYLFKDPSD